MRCDRNILAVAAFLGFTGIILGAFGAHGLKKMVDEAGVDSFQTGVTYQIYHALFLLFVGIAPLSLAQKKRIFLITILGVLCFSGSIYALIWAKSCQSDALKSIWFVTPLGGVLLIVAWLLSFIYFLQAKK